MSRKDRRTTSLYTDENDNWHFIKKESSCYAPERIEDWGLAYRLMDDSDYHYDNAYNMTRGYHGGIDKDIQWSVTFDIFEKNPATTCEKVVEVAIEVLRNPYIVISLLIIIALIFAYLHNTRQGRA